MAGRPTAPPPIRCARCNPFSPPPACRATPIYVRTYKPAGSTLASIKINYAKLVADGRPMRAVAARSRRRRRIAPISENRPYWNLGCASQRNLAAMVDNPADLVQPRGETPAYAAAPLGGDRQLPQG